MPGDKLEKIKILVLDDDESITRLTRSVLNMHGYDVTEFNNPAEALTAVKTSVFDLIMVDIIMPGMDGISFINKAKEYKINSDAKYAILSGKRLNEDDRRKIFDLGAEIMTKPFIPQKLVEKIGEIMS